MGFVVFDRVLLDVMSKHLSFSEVPILIVCPLLEDFSTIGVPVLTRDHLGGHAMFVCSVRMRPMHRQGKDDCQMAVHTCKVEGRRSRGASDNYRRSGSTPVLVGGVPAR